MKQKQDAIWSKENQYPLAEIKATLEAWLKRRTSQIILVPRVARGEA